MARDRVRPQILPLYLAAPDHRPHGVNGTGFPKRDHCVRVHPLKRSSVGLSALASADPMFTLPLELADAQWFALGLVDMIV